MLTFQADRHFNSPPHTIFNIVKDVEKYPHFLPWLKEVRVFEKSEYSFKADFKIHYGPWSASYISHVTIENKAGTHIIQSKALEGQLDYLNSCWQICPHDNGSFVNYKLELITKSKTLEFFLSPLIASLGEKIIRAFEVEFTHNINPLDNN